MALRFNKGTVGYNAEVIVAPAVAVSAAANITAFSDAPAPLGQVAVFDYDTNALISAALVEGQKFYLAQRRAAVNGGTEVKRTSPYVYRKNGVLALDYLAPVLDAWTFTLPATYTPVAGDEISVKVIETADQSQVPPMFTYTYRVKGGDTLALIYAGLKAAVDNQPPAVGTGDEPFVTATSSAAGLLLTHKFFQAGFRVATPGKSYEVGATVTHTTPAVWGSGFYDEVAQLEYEGEVFDGVTTQYPGGNFVPSDFGTTPRYAVAGTNYGKINLNLYADEYSPTPVNKHHHLKHLVLVLVQDGAIQTQFETIFGLAVAGG